ncbi:MAG: recombinase family protein [Planctomycetes bacterium]|nr:recombinase family protein [Planctomycetota bacterium]
MTRRSAKPLAPLVMQCAIYTRKSTEEGLEQEFNSLDAQRDAGEAYISSQRHEGWVCLPNRYDDGGFTGGNMERPALQRLMADIEAGRVNCVVVYKVDRLSRSLLDFARMMEVFEKHHVSFVSVTQQFNTATSMGRLILNVLLSFAQFEREMISERTRDKIAATRRKGKWSGGMPILGYNVVETKLVVNEAEAQQVREIFDLYLQRQSLLAVAKELNARDRRTKHWITRKGTARGGRRFDKNAIYDLLTNVAYVGKVRYKDEVHRGEHRAIVDAETFNQAQSLLQRNGRAGGKSTRHPPALLRGVLRCTACGCGMSHTYTAKGNRQYCYYVCHRAQKQGWQVCPSPSIPAGEIERFVIDQLKGISHDPLLIEETLVQARRQTEDQIQRLTAERPRLMRELRDGHVELTRLATSAEPGEPGLPDAHDRIRHVERRLAELDGELASIEASPLNKTDVAAVLADFDALWGCLAPHEQARAIELLVEQVAYDGRVGSISITFRPAGLTQLALELALRKEQVA